MRLISSRLLRCRAQTKKMTTWTIPSKTEVILMKSSSVKCYKTLIRSLIMMKATTLTQQEVVIFVSNR
jgi:hypothetical protein